MPPRSARWPGTDRRAGSRLAKAVRRPAELEIQGQCCAGREQSAPGRAPNRFAARGLHVENRSPAQTRCPGSQAQGREARQRQVESSLLRARVEQRRSKALLHPPLILPSIVAIRSNHSVPANRKINSGTFL